MKTPFERVEDLVSEIGMTYQDAIGIIQLEILVEIKEVLKRGNNGNTD